MRCTAAASCDAAPRRSRAMRPAGSAMDLSKRHPPSLSPRALAIAGWSACALGAALFFAIAWNISGESRLIAFDQRVSEWLQAQHSSALVTFLLLVTHLNST